MSFYCFENNLSLGRMHATYNKGPKAMLAFRNHLDRLANNCECSNNTRGSSGYTPTISKNSTNVEDWYCVLYCRFFSCTTVCGESGLGLALLCDYQASQQLVNLANNISWMNIAVKMNPY